MGPNLFRDLGCEIPDIVTVVAVFGMALVAPDCQHARTQVSDLGTGVIEVVLARDPLPPGLEHAREQVPDEGPAGVADVEGAGGVGRHEFHVHGALTDWSTRPHSAGASSTAVDRGFQGVIGQPEIDEAWWSNLDGGPTASSLGRLQSPA
jgi:hypothetical protein